MAPGGATASLGPMARPSEPAPDWSGDAPSFEEALERLESLVDRLEDGDLPLEEALAAFEQGVALSRGCMERLERAERRIEALVAEAGGATVHAVEDELDGASD